MIDSLTQCLSMRGWLFPEQAAEGEIILAFDIENEGLRWTPISCIHKDHGAYRIWSTSQLSMALSDSHRMPVANRNTEGAWSLVSINDIKSQHILQRSCRSLLDQPQLPSIADSLVELVAWVAMEGSYRPPSRRGNGIVVSQKTHKTRVWSLMNEFGVARGHEKKDGCHCWEITGNLADQIRSIAPNRAPLVSWLRQLTKRQLRIFIDSCILGDGTETNGAKWNRLDRRSIAQKPGMILNSFLAACTMAGIPVSRTTETSQTKSAETWSLRSSRLIEFRKLSTSEPTTGPLFSLTNAFHTFVARRNNSIFIAGN